MILVTGAVGFIGSHTSIELLCAKYSVLGLDNFSNSSKSVLPRIEKITNKSMTFVEVDICDAEVLGHLFEEYSIDAVIHFDNRWSIGCEW